MNVVLEGVVTSAPFFDPTHKSMVPVCNIVRMPSRSRGVSKKWRTHADLLEHSQRGRPIECGSPIPNLQSFAPPWSYTNRHHRGRQVSGLAFGSNRIHVQIVVSYRPDPASPTQSIKPDKVIPQNLIGNLQSDVVQTHAMSANVQTERNEFHKILVQLV